MAAGVDKGTTSACAENTIGRHHRGRRSWNYLRVRGEYSPTLDSIEQARELPPRARRIHFVQQVAYVGFGTTSACAENTRPPPQRQARLGNYLRVRGEYGFSLGGTGRR